MREADEILDLYRQRSEAASARLARLRAVNEVVDGELKLHTTERGKNEKAAVPNLTQHGLDQYARRIASVMPTNFFPALASNETAEKDANKRVKVMNGWWAENKMKRVLGKRARWYLGYAMAPVIIKPDKTRKIPHWIPRSPSDTFPSNTDILEYTPQDCIFATQHSYAWLLKHFKEQALAVRKPDGFDPKEPGHLETMFTVLEYNDSEEDVLVLVGADKEDVDGYWSQTPGSDAETLVRAKNLAGIPWAVVPGRITLNKTVGHFDGILGMYQTMAELMAMQIIATRRGIWAREWVVANPGETPKVLQIPDPAQGRPGRISGGKLERQQIDSSFAAMNVIHDIQASQRQTAGLPPEFGGEGATNVRTGRRGGQVLSAAIDYTIQEANEIFAESLYEEDRRAIALDKAYFNRQKKFFIVTRSWQGEVTYTPSKLWESDKHVVDYPFAGVDLGNLVLEGGQRVAMETMSQETFMEMDPAVPDVDGERQRIWLEKGRRAFFSSFEQAASMPDGPYRPEDVAAILQMIRQGDTPEDALRKQDEKMKELQAQAMAEQEQMMAGEMGPEGQPGLAPVGAPGEVPAAIPQAEPSLQNMAAMLGRLGTTQQAQKFRGQ